MRSKWVVSVSSENDEPLVVGPYSEQQAREIVDKFNASVDALPEDDRLGNFIHASCYPLRRLTITQLRHEFDLKRVIASS